MRRMLLRLLPILLLMLATGVVSSYGQAPAARPAPAVPSGLSDDPLPGVPPGLDRNDIYSETRPDTLSAAVRALPSGLYVPNGLKDTVDVSHPHTSHIIEG